MFSNELLIDPIVYPKAKEKTIYLPKGHTWTDVFTKKVYEGGQYITIPVNIQNIPVFSKDNSEIMNIF